MTTAFVSAAPEFKSKAIEIICGQIRIAAKCRECPTIVFEGRGKKLRSYYLNRVCLDGSVRKQIKHLWESLTCFLGRPPGHFLHSDYSLEQFDFAMRAINRVACRDSRVSCELVRFSGSKPNVRPKWTIHLAMVSEDSLSVLEDLLRRVDKALDDTKIFVPEKLLPQLMNA